MSPALEVAIVSAGLSAVGAALTFYVTKRAERLDKLQQRKLEHYGQLMNAISDLASDEVNQREANERFNQAANTIVLVAPQRVIQALMEFHDEIRISNMSRSQAGHDNRLKALVLALRESLDLPFADDPSTFQFHLIGRKPPNVPS